mgnify:CR=1 FL=1|jgi:hypothetical protein
MERDRAEPIWVSQSGNSQATVKALHSQLSAIYQNF